MVQPLFADVRRQIAGHELVRHVRLVRHAPAQQLAKNGRDAQDALAHPEGKTGGVALHGGDVLRRDLVECDWIDEKEPLDPLRPARRETQRNGAAQVEADDRGLGEPERRERAVDELGLRGDAEIRVEGTVGLAVAEEIDGEGGTVRQGDLGRDVPPDEARRAESVQEDDRGSAMAVALDVHRARPDGNAQQISVDGTFLRMRGRGDEGTKGQPEDSRDGKAGVPLIPSSPQYPRSSPMHLPRRLCPEAAPP